MFSSIAFYIGEKVLGLNDREYPLVELTAEVLNISPEEYQAELPRGPALLSYLGCGELKYIDCRTRQPFLPSDILLLCSDGFCELLPDDAMARTLNSLDDSMTNLPDLTAPLLDRAGRGQDNASAVVIRCRTIQQCK